MPSLGLWLWYINITIIILDIIHRPVFYLKHDVSETGFGLRLQVEPTQMGPMCVSGPVLPPTLHVYGLNTDNAVKLRAGKRVAESARPTATKWATSVK
jgi:hypothetical protein